MNCRQKYKMGTTRFEVCQLFNVPIQSRETACFAIAAGSADDVDVVDAGGNLVFGCSLKMQRLGILSAVPSCTKNWAANWVKKEVASRANEREEYLNGILYSRSKAEQTSEKVI